MNVDATAPLAPEAGSAFHVWQVVRIKEDIFDPPANGSDGETYALAGDIALITSIGVGKYPVRVKPIDRDVEFRVGFDEIETWNANGSEAEEKS